jgi:methyltransferase-like protein/SAM-dependent methyltransferase
LSDPLLASYEAVPYDSRAITFADVSTMETWALLHGLRSPPGDACRVLELGCGSGGNIIPMAYQLPGSQFVGVDLASSQISEGLEMIAELGLSNISLKSMNIADIDDAFGEFDYVICHGVYSWVPPDVQDAILRVCSRNLAAAGVAYVSYNTYPGWHVRGMVRDMLLFNDVPSLPPDERVARARTFVDALVAAQPNASSPYALLLAEEQRALRGQSDAHLLHEQLEVFNTPLYFNEFMRRAASRGLKYVAEAKVLSSARVFPDALRRAGIDDSDVIRAQQYIDFATRRTFRRTLLCHDTAAISPRPSADAMVELYLTMRATSVEPSADDAARSANVQSFESPDGVKVTTNNPLVLAALGSLLRVAPATLSFAELLRRVEARLDADATPGLQQDVSDRRGDLAQAMLQCLGAGLVVAGRRPSTFVTRVTERPVASAVARYEARETPLVPTLRHTSFELSALDRFILVHLDGSNTRADVLALVEQGVADGVMASADRQPAGSELAALVDAALNRFAKLALLEH